MAAGIPAAWHGRAFRRTDGDGFRVEQLSKEKAKLPTTTRQQSAEETLQVGRDVLPDVHESIQLSGQQARDSLKTYRDNTDKAIAFPVIFRKFSPPAIISPALTGFGGLLGVGLLNRQGA